MKYEAEDHIIQLAIFQYCDQQVDTDFGNRAKKEPLGFKASPTSFAQPCMLHDNQVAKMLADWQA